MLLVQVCIGASLLFNAVLAAPDNDVEKSPPNILFIMTDEMKWDSMGVAGHPLVKTPNLDKLAHEGTYFPIAYTVAPICSPSRRSFFTGRYPHQHGVTNNSTHSMANDGEVDLPTMLKHYGYTTAIAGKLHFYPDSQDWGFDYFWSRGGEGSNKLESYKKYMIRKYGKDAFKIVDGSAPYPDDPLGRDMGRYAFSKEDYETYWLTDRSIEFLREQKERGGPFFLFTSYNEPHSPYRAVEPYASMYDPDDVEVSAIPDKVKKARAEALERGIKGPSRHLVDDPDMVKQLTSQYLGHVTNVDDNIGRLLDELENLGLDDNTIVVFSADHGNMLGDHGHWFKGVMYEGSARIPLIIQAGKRMGAADVFNRGNIVTQVVENIDVMPTLLELAGLPVPNQITGNSLVMLAAGQAPWWANRAFSQRTRLMVRDGDHKLIVDKSVLEPSAKRKRKKDITSQSALDSLHPSIELFNLVTDPGENNNLAEEMGHEERIAYMLNLIREWLDQDPGPISVPGLQPPAYLFNTQQ